MTEENNPFLALFNSDEEAFFRETSATIQRKELCALLTRIFLFTGSYCEDYEPSLLKGLPRYVLHLPQLSHNEAARGQSGVLSTENYLQGLAERILLSSSDFELLDLQSGLDNRLLLEKINTLEPSAMNYLAECYSRAENESKLSVRKRERAEERADDDLSEVQAKSIEQCKREIVERASVVIRTDNAKALIQSTASSCQFVQLLKKALSPGSKVSLHFFYDVAQCQSDNLEALKAMFDVVLEDLYSSHEVIKLSTTDLDSLLNLLEFFTSQSSICKVLTTFKHWLPPNLTNGRAFQTQTILGKFLSPSCIAEQPQSPSSYFPMEQKPYQSEVEEMTISLRYQLDDLTMRLFKIFNAILRAGPECRKQLITWLVLCFESNSDRGKMVAHRALAAHVNQASDGFFMNLSWIMLRLCIPFMSVEQVESTRKSKVTIIDLSYCACTDRRQLMSVDTGGPLADFSRDSKLVPPSEDTSQDQLEVPLNVPFNFITHCFFLTHKCLMLGMTHVINKYQDIHRHLSHLHRVIGVFDDFQAPPGTAQWYYKVFSSQMLGIKAHALHPTVIELCLSFYATTAEWMVQQVLEENETIPDKPVPLIRIIPECLVENMSDIVMALRQMDSQLTLLPHHVHSYISFCTIYMRSSSFVNNPHIRAKLAQLISFIIHKDEDIDLQKEVFSTHRLAGGHLVTALLSIFVDIEHTGESMEFEDKFAYRLPMYEILEFLWTLPSYQASIDNLSEEVLAYSGVTRTTPVFLRFMNMIINDAIVQLDEGLDSLATIKKLDDLKNSDEWATYSDERKKEHADKLREATMYATNRNKLGDKTVHIIRVITNSVRKPFVIAGIVDRMAAMLNYVLALLVGKENRNLKVRDAAKYHFSPRTLVRTIVAIYINLGTENCFCEALPRDGRSFSMDLFPQAERVLRLVAAGEQDSVISDWKALSHIVEGCLKKLKFTETLFENAPEEFLDPLTQELMDDPVILPSSGHTVDRSSIMRHLLSDEHDPFNRAPLTPDMLQTNHSLRDNIVEWKKEKTG